MRLQLYKFIYNCTFCVKLHIEKALKWGVKCLYSVPIIKRSLK